MTNKSFNHPQLISFVHEETTLKVLKVYLKIDHKIEFHSTEIQLIKKTIKLNIYL